MKIDIKSKTIDELSKIILSMGGQKYLAKYLFTFIHSKAVTDISEVTPISKGLRQQLIEQGYYISNLEMSKRFVAADGTQKFLFGLADGKRIESVLIKEAKSNKKESSRKTLCVSTQVGCAMDCSFCATAKMGFERNLTAGEIVDQVNIAAGKVDRISNVVFMGMGEPLLNYEAVIDAIRILNDEAGTNIGIRHITISTCGIVPGIRKLASEVIMPRLAVSLNAPADPLRSELMPINNKYPLADLFKAIRFYQEQTGKRVTFEYVMIKGVNDGDVHTRLLIKLLNGIMCNVNLIEHNPHPGSDLTGSDTERILRFAGILKRANIETAIRFRMGRDIKAACGQLGADSSRIG